MIPHATTHVVKDGRRAQKSKGRYERGKAVAEVIAKVATDGQLAAIMSSILGAVAGPVLLVIPALLPLTAFAAAKIGERCAHKVEGCAVDSAVVYFD